jgi:hypothetical protein
MRFLHLPNFATTEVHEIGDNTDFLRFCPGCGYVLGNDDLCYNDECGTVIDAEPSNQQQQIEGRR